MGDEPFLPAAAAAELLGVKRETLYAYVSRGWLESVPDPRSSRARLYARGDLERLRARASARAGDAPVAAGALRWGAPVLETQICEITPDGPRYRGRALPDLIENCSFEQVAELLWSGEIPAERAWTPIVGTQGTGPNVDRIRLAVLNAELGDPTRDVRTDEAAANQARTMFGAMTAVLGAADVPGYAERIASALAPSPTSAINRAVETALIVCAEHELNASTFATRVAASTGANLYACVTAGLAAFVGPRHGAMSARVRRLLAECQEREPRDVLLERLRAGEPISGFGHPLYPAGDPRFTMLWDAARAVDESKLTTLAGLVEAGEQAGLGRPHLDTGLVAIAIACDLSEGAESAIFAVGRTAGWIAHAREQTAQNFILRPRAHYTGT